MLCITRKKELGVRSDQLLFSNIMEAASRVQTLKASELFRAHIFKRSKWRKLSVSESLGECRKVRE